MNKKNITIILSTYNEKLSIENTINELIKHIDNVEIVVVDDNSPDGTFEILKNIKYEKLKIFSRKKNKGLASAFLLGLINASGDVIGWLDSNMGILAKKFPEMISNLENVDIVLLSRYVSGGRDDRNIVRVLSSRIINSIAKFVLRSKIHDLSSGIFVMKRKVLLDVVPIASGHGEFMVEFLHQAEKKGNKIFEIPYVHPVDIEGNSKSFPNLLKFLLFGFFYILRLFQSIFRR
jgi:dolichol-phosphate mannosyltransferase